MPASALKAERELLRELATLCVRGVHSSKDTMYNTVCPGGADCAAVDAPEESETGDVVGAWRSGVVGVG